MPRTLLTEPDWPLSIGLSGRKAHGHAEWTAEGAAGRRVPSAGSPRCPGRAVVQTAARSGENIRVELRTQTSHGPAAAEKNGLGQRHGEKGPRQTRGDVTTEGSTA